VTAGSLFSGIGGIDLGLERAGMTIRWQVEKDAWCRRVLSKHWPDVPKYEDITTLTGHELERVDVLAGGFPCQPASVAGTRKGNEDVEKWLWPHFEKLIRVLRPRIVLVENVPGLFTVNGGAAFGEIIGSLASMRYDCEWDVISAADVGAPHLRKRVWIVAHADSEGLQGMRGKRSDAGRENTSGYAGSGCVAVADAEGFFSNGGYDNRGGRSRPLSESGNSGEEARSIGGWWAVEPNVGRVAHGVSKRVDRLRGLGNAVVPQIVEWIGRRIRGADDK
jgi:DNA (cytosine-5)-methyltransferase 1